MNRLERVTRQIPGLWLAMAALVAGCGGVPTDPAADPSADPEQVEPAERELWWDTGKFWLQRPLVLPVCFEVPASNNPGAVRDDDARRWIQRAVEANWSRFARITFVGWGDCPGTGTFRSGLRVQVNDQGLNCTARVNCGDAFGREIDGVPNGVRISQCNAGSGCERASREEAVTVMALHEFGHALGFQHEEDRRDSGRKSCGAPPDQDGPTDQRFGAFDINSVMSTCGVLAQNSTWTEISPNDIAAAQYVYGRRIAGSLQTAVGLCLKAGHFVPGQTGHRPYFGPCDEFEDGDEWRRPAGSRQLRIQPPGASGAACLHAPTRGNGEIRNCSSTANFDWRFENVQIRGLGAMCLDLSGGNTNGGQVIVHRCAGSKNRPDLNGSDQNQRWSLLATGGPGEIRFGGPSSPSCLTVPGGSTQNGVGLTVAACNGSTSQRFDLNDRGEIKFTNNGISKCLDVQGPTESQWLGGAGLADAPARVQLWDCANKVPFQRWNLSGPIRRSTGGSCLDWGAGWPGQLPFSATCNNTVFQTWDYHPRR
jgi:hypothetical protein